MSDAKKDPLPLAAQLTKGIDSVDLHEFAGGIAQEMATLPQIASSREDRRVLPGAHRRCRRPPERREAYPG